MRVTKKLKEKAIKALFEEDIHTGNARKLLYTAAERLRNCSDEKWQTAMRLAAEKNPFISQQETISLLELPEELIRLYEPYNYGFRELSHNLGYSYAAKKSDIHLDDYCWKGSITPLEFLVDGNGNVLNSWGISMDDETEKLIAEAYKEILGAYAYYKEIKEHIGGIRAFDELAAIYPKVIDMAEKMETGKKKKPVPAETYLNNVIKEALI